MSPLNQHEGLDLLNGSFVSIPYVWFTQFSTLELSHEEFVVLVQILGAIQVSGNEIISPSALGQLCRIPEKDVVQILDKLIEKSFLAIVRATDIDGNQSLQFSLTPLWKKLQTPSATNEGKKAQSEERDLVTLFEQEFGRPLSGLECEQIRQWLGDGAPDWMLIEALREAVLANKCSFRYMDRIVYDWQRNRIRTRQELDAYRQSYRERTQAREEAAASTQLRKGSQAQRSSTKKQPTEPKSPNRDNRYSAFYELFPDA